MHQDLIDGVDWLVKQGVADQKKVAIIGGSYGGYATLVGLTFTPDVFACGVDIVGPSNIVDAAEDDPAVLGPDEGDVQQARRRPGEGGGLPERALAALRG